MGGILGLLGLTIVVAVPVAALVALARTSTLRRRIDVLEREVKALRRAGLRTSPLLQERQSPAAPVLAPTPEPAPAPASAQPPPEWAPPASAPAPAAERREWPAPPPDPFDRLLKAIWGWFTDGNVPVKVGVVVLFAGVGALLKYAADQGWMRFPVELRLAGIALAAFAALAFGWRQRRLRRVFALSVQGGAIGVLLMTAYAAWKLYALVGPGTAFALWVIFSAAAGLLALWQEARALAVLGILAGFLAPILMSTGSGNHVALFSFYAVLNTAIFGIAWLRNWRELNLMGFAFTFGIGIWWGVLEYHPDKFASTLPFLALFFAFYLLIPLLHSRRAVLPARIPVDGTLVFGTPLVSFALLAGLLEGERMPLAASALGLAALYGLLAWRITGDRVPLLRQAHGILGAAFATLAVPLALSAHATASVFALEGAALVWFGLRQARRLPVLAGAVLQALAAGWFVHGLGAVQYDLPVANAGCMGALLLAVAGIASAWSHGRAGERDNSLLYFLWGLAWWLVASLREVIEFLPREALTDGLLGFTALTAALAALGPRKHLGAAPGWTAALAVAAAIPLAIGQSSDHQHPFAQHGLVAWGVYAALGWLALRRLRARSEDSAALAHGAWLVAWALAASLWLSWLSGDAALASGWVHAASAFPWLLAGAVLLLRPGWIPWRPEPWFDEWRATLLTLWQAILAIIVALLLLQPGDAAPLPWMPLLNPLELSLVAAVLLLATWLRSDGAPAVLARQRAPLLSLAVLLALTSCTLRAVHQLGGVPWSMAIFDTALAQAALSVVWSVLGVAGWVAGSRRQQRDLWRIGALLMAIVLAKLVLVDRTHLGNLPGIISFISYGLLCTAVGYLAPAPPRQKQA